MAQFFRPSANITQTNTSGSYTDIDEVSFSDSDYVTSNDNSNGIFEFRITVGGGAGDPGVNTGHTVRLRHAKSDTNVAPSTTGNTQEGDYYLYQGVTLIATLGNIADEGNFAAIDYTLSGTEADNITDYDDLRVRCDWPSSGGGPAGNRRGGAISWAEMETPDPPTAYTLEAEKGSFVLSGKNIDFPYFRHYTMPAEKGSFILDGKDATLTHVKHITMSAEKGSFVLSGKDITFIHQVFQHKSLIFNGKRVIHNTKILTYNGN